MALPSLRVSIASTIIGRDPPAELSVRIVKSDFWKMLEDVIVALGEERARALFGQADAEKVLEGWCQRGLNHEEVRRLAHGIRHAAFDSPYPGEVAVRLRPTFGSDQPPGYFAVLASMLETFAAFGGSESVVRFEKVGDT